MNFDLLRHRNSVLFAMNVTTKTPFMYDNEVRGRKTACNSIPSYSVSFIRKMYKICRRFGYNAVYIGRYLLANRTKFFYPEDGGSTFPRDVRVYSPDYMTSHAKRRP
jgi:hypothetical protein